MSEQQLLIDAIYGNDDHQLDPAGVDIYRRNLEASAIRALSISFPTVEELIGEDLFGYFSHQYLRTTPPEGGNWASWGETFPDMLVDHPAIEDYPFISDCAKLDWLLHLCGQGIDQAVMQDSLQLLASEDPDNLYVQFNGNLHLLSSPYPVASIYQLHQSDSEEARRALMNQVKAKLSEGIGEHLVTYRPQFKPLCSEVDSAEQRIFSALQAGNSLSSALELLGEDEFSFEHWLVSCLERNLIVRIYTES